MRRGIVIGLGMLLFASLDALLIPSLFGLGQGWWKRQNEQGASEWEATRQDILKRREPLHYRELVPAEIPDYQNLAAIPFFRTAPDPTSALTILPVGQIEALAKLDPKNSAFPLIRTSPGWKYDPQIVESYLAARYRLFFRDAKELPTSLAQFDALCPALLDLRVETGSRPGCRFRRDYTSLPSSDRSLNPVTSLILLAKVINLHALVALREDRSYLAFKDILVVLKIDGAVSREPILISGLVAIGDEAIIASALREGLRSHVWSNTQIASLQQELRKIDFLADGQLCLRAGAIDFMVPVLESMQENADPGDLMRRVFTKEKIDLGPLIRVKPGNVTPIGWYDRGKAKAVSILYQAAREGIDPDKRRASPAVTRDLKKKVEDFRRYDVADMLIKIWAGPVLNSISKFACGQARLDMAILACGLERYRMLHGTFPNSLEALKPYLPGDIPHDPMSGEPYRYQLRKDGTYLLYSIGWDLKDDGGLLVYRKDQPEFLDTEQGDWVWPTAN